MATQTGPHTAYTVNSQDLVEVDLQGAPSGQKAVVRGSAYRLNTILQSINGRVSQLENTAAVPDVSLTAQIAQATSDLMLVAVTYNPVVGASVTLNKVGTYLFTACCGFAVIGAGDIGIFLQGRLVVNNVAQPALAVFAGASGDTVSCFQQWMVPVGAVGQNAHLEANKTGGLGTSTIYAAYTNLSCLWISP